MSDLEELKCTLTDDVTDYHQHILDVAYNHWKEVGGSMLENLLWVQETYGDLARFAVQMGKYNQQVQNGGHAQYYFNGYAAAHSDGCDSEHNDTELHDWMLDFMLEDEHLKKLKLTKTVHEIASVELKFNEEETYWGDEEQDIYNEDGEIIDTKLVYGEHPNEEFGELLNELEVVAADSKYFEICDEWMDELECLFKSLLT